IVGTCLAKQPDRRFASFKEVREQLAGLYHRLTGQAPPRPAEAQELSHWQVSNKAVSLSSLRQGWETLHCLDRAIQLHPNNAVTWSNKGHVLANLDRFEEALRCYDLAVELDPSNAELWYNKANTLSELEQPEDALVCYDRALQLDSGHPGSWN